MISPFTFFILSTLQLSAEESCGGENQLAFHLWIGAVAFGGVGIRDRCHTANNVARTDDGHGAVDKKAAAFREDVDGISTVAMTVERSLFDDLLQLLGECLIVIFFFRDSRAGDDGVTVADNDREGTHLMKRIRILRRKGRKLTDGGVLLKNNLALAIGINFQRVSFTDNIDTDRSLLFSYAGAVEKGWDES